MLFQLDQLLSDPVSLVKSLLIALPGILLALSIHESAHGLIAEKCGDPTARYAGRITLNPLKHFDPFGFLCTLLIGFGWAKPVPVNPLLYKNYRRDDLKVSLAGICANLLLFLVCFLILSLIFTGALAKLPSYDLNAEIDQLPYYSILDYNDLPGNERPDCFRTTYFEDCIMTPDGYIPLIDAEIYGRNTLEAIRGDLPDGPYLLSYNGRTEVELPGYYRIGPDSLFPSFYYWSEAIISPALGPVGAVLYEMIAYCMLINLSLAVFNLIPLPPLDGYHVLNDLVLRQDLFAQRRTQQITSYVLLALILIGNIKPEYDVISILINGVREGVLGFLSFITKWIASLAGVI